MKRACDGSEPCALCFRRGKTCERSVRRKSGPAKGAKYAPRRSKEQKDVTKVEKDIAATIVAVTTAAAAKNKATRGRECMGPLGMGPLIEAPSMRGRFTFCMLLCWPLANGAEDRFRWSKWAIELTKTPENTAVGSWITPVQRIAVIQI